MNFLSFLIGPVGILIITVVILIYTAVRRPAWFNSYMKMWGGKGYDDPFYPFQRWTADPASVPWRNKRLQFAAVMMMFFAVGLAFFLKGPGAKPWSVVAVLWIFAAYFLWLVVRITRFGNGR